MTPDAPSLEYYFDKLGIADASLSVKEEILEELGREIMKQIFLDLRAALPDEALRDIEREAAAGDLADITVALKKHVPDAEGFIRRSAEKVIADFAAS